jgi:hypothetical protein
MHFCDVQNKFVLLRAANFCGAKVLAKCGSSDFCQIALKKDTGIIGSLGTGHPNVRCSQARDMPRWKSKLQSELLQSPPNLFYLFYIYGFATLRTIA